MTGSENIMAPGANRAEELVQYAGMIDCAAQGCEAGDHGHGTLLWLTEPAPAGSPPPTMSDGLHKVTILSRRIDKQRWGLHKPIPQFE